MSSQKPDTSTVCGLAEATRGFASQSQPGSRCLSGSPDGKRWYFANKPGPLTPEGFNQEPAIKEIWANDSAD